MYTVIASVICSLIITIYVLFRFKNIFRIGLAVLIMGGTLICSLTAALVISDYFNYKIKNTIVERYNPINTSVQHLPLYNSNGAVPKLSYQILTHKEGKNIALQYPSKHVDIKRYNEKSITVKTDQVIKECAPWCFELGEQRYTIFLPENIEIQKLILAENE